MCTMFADRILLLPNAVLIVEVASVYRGSLIAYVDISQYGILCSSW